MEQAPKIQVLIANDQSLVREGLAAVLNRQKDIRVVAQTGKLSQVVDYFQRYRPNVLLIDLRLGGSDTIETIKTICEKHPSAAILMFSEYDGSEDIYRALRAGARGYVLKDVSNSEMIEAIRTLSSGRNHISPVLAARLTERMNKSTLTRREMEVLQLIVKGKSNKEIGDTLNVAEDTVKYHVRGILTKLGVTDRTQAATAALLRGIINPLDL